VLGDQQRAYRLGLERCDDPVTVQLGDGDIVRLRAEGDDVVDRAHLCGGGDRRLVTEVETYAALDRSRLELTPLGRSLLEPLRAVRRWAEAHVPDIEAANAAASTSLQRSGSST
jgi:hypothetical protein